VSGTASIKRVALWAVLPLLLVAGGILLFTRDTWSGGGCDEQIVAGREPPSTDTLGLAEVVIVSSSGSVSPITGDWVAVQPSFSPAGDEVVVVRAEGDYESSGPDHSELWVVGAEGGDARRLTTGPLDDDPDWGPRLDRIAFLRFDGPTTSLMVVPGEGGESRVVYRPPDGTWLATPAWSPDGQSIAFLQVEATSAATDRTTLMVVNGDGEGLRVVAPMPYTQSIDWHPDGDFVLVVSETNVYKVDIGSGNVAQVATGIHSARWAPDGERVFFTTSPDGILYEGTLTAHEVMPRHRIADLGTGFYKYLDMDVNDCT
jgi:dipeptidyl aminopeptidase/acylaminoacyl peptidase